jgi:hypothetical protein
MDIKGPGAPGIATLVPARKTTANGSGRFRQVQAARRRSQAFGTSRDSVRGRPVRQTVAGTVQAKHGGGDSPRSALQRLDAMFQGRYTGGAGLAAFERHLDLIAARLESLTIPAERNGALVRLAEVCIWGASRTESVLRCMATLEWVEPQVGGPDRDRLAGELLGEIARLRVEYPDGDEAAALDQWVAAHGVGAPSGGSTYADDDLAVARAMTGLSGLNMG